MLCLVRAQRSHHFWGIQLQHGIQRPTLERVAAPIPVFSSVPGEAQNKLASLGLPALQYVVYSTAMRCVPH